MFDTEGTRRVDYLCKTGKNTTLNVKDWDFRAPQVFISQVAQIIT